MIHDQTFKDALTRTCDAPVWYFVRKIGEQQTVKPYMEDELYNLIFWQAHSNQQNWVLREPLFDGFGDSKRPCFNYVRSCCANACENRCEDKSVGKGAVRRQRCLSCGTVITLAAECGCNDTTYELNRIRDSYSIDLDAGRDTYVYSEVCGDDRKLFISGIASCLHAEYGYRNSLNDFSCSVYDSLKALLMETKYDPELIEKDAFYVRVYEGVKRAAELAASGQADKSADILYDLLKRYKCFFTVDFYEERSNGKSMRAFYGCVHNKLNDVSRELTNCGVAEYSPCGESLRRKLGQLYKKFNSEVDKWKSSPQVWWLAVALQFFAKMHAIDPGVVPNAALLEFQRYVDLTDSSNAVNLSVAHKGVKEDIKAFRNSIYTSMEVLAERVIELLELIKTARDEVLK
ncbi:MAG: hypothetical protein FWE91_08825 [Defluviitaleaceae bacterium]|nr:hypothetical protein [Defluviitaleaceae bacterium]MCL2836034.1 hypothetical protein [Defluviitaleaceae bacterium]